MGRAFFDINHRKILFDLPPRVRKIKTKINKQDHKQNKKNPQNGRKSLQMKQQGINLQNIQTEHVAQYQKANNPIKAWVEDISKDGLKST